MKVSKDKLRQIILEEVANFREEEKEIQEPLKEEVDEHGVDELSQYIMNDAQLYRGQYIPIVKNLMNKKAKGVFDPALAVKLFLYLVNEGAKRYAKEFHSVFDKETRVAVAEELTQAFVEESETGAFDQYLYKKYQVKEETPPGREDQVKALKKELPKTYTDKKTGERKKSNPWAVAWASYNKNKE